MPEVNQYLVKPKELVELIIKSAGIREGRWWLVANFGISPGNFGPTPDEAMPGMAFAIQSIGIQREVPGTPAPPGLVVDAAKVDHEPAVHRATTPSKPVKSGRSKTS
jgi:hypothetical protein